jgi:DNA-binding response OmpR family regulator
MARILVVDDQAGVRAMIGIVLRVGGFEVIEADSAASALTAFENSSFDLAIVDVFLEGTNGLDLIAKMRERVADLPVVAISGMTKLDRLAQAPELAGVVCLQKPFRPNELIEAIEAVYHLPPQTADDGMGVAEGTASDLDAKTPRRTGAFCG